MLYIHDVGVFSVTRWLQMQDGDTIIFCYNATVHFSLINPPKTNCSNCSSVAHQWIRFHLLRLLSLLPPRISWFRCFVNDTIPVEWSFAVLLRLVYISLISWMIQLKQKRKSISIFSDAENPCSLGLVDILEGEVVEAYIEAACKVVVADVLVATQ